MDFTNSIINKNGEKSGIVSRGVEKSNPQLLCKHPWPQLLVGVSFW